MKAIRIAVIVIILALLAGFFIFSAGNDTQQWVLHSMEEWENSHFWLVLVIFGLTLISTLTGLPVLYLSVALGFFLAYLPALAFAMVINLVAVMTTFVFVRKLYYSYFKKKYGDRKLIRSINRRIRKYGFWTVALTRAVYFIPTNIINYSFPLSKITYRKYLVGTMIGLVPECLVNVSTGYLLRHEVMLLNNPEQNLLKIVVIAVSMVVMIGLFLFFRYRRKRNARIRLKEVVPMLDDQ